MSYLRALIFIVLLLAVFVFALQNTNPVTIRFLTWGTTAPVAIVAVAIYTLGMLSGWSVVSLIRGSMRSARKASGS